jgi:hypothetical protein
VVYPNSAEGRRWRARRPLLLFNPNAAKDARRRSWRWPPAAGAVSFPAALRAADGAAHPFFEGLAAGSATDAGDLVERWPRMPTSRWT